MIAFLLAAELDVNLASMAEGHPLFIDEPSVFLWKGNIDLTLHNNTLDLYLGRVVFFPRWKIIML